jgi:hypothetical protein
MEVVTAHARCDREQQVGAALPALIADLHTSIEAGRDVAELLDLAVFLHVGATTGWLRVAGAEIDLREQAVLLGRQAAQERDTPTALGLATWGGLHVLLIDSATELALAELDATTVPMNSPESMQLAGMRAATGPGPVSLPHPWWGPVSRRAGGRRSSYCTPWSVAGPPLDPTDRRLELSRLIIALDGRLVFALHDPSPSFSRVGATATLRTFGDRLMTLPDLRHRLHYPQILAGEFIQARRLRDRS